MARKQLAVATLPESVCNGTALRKATRRVSQLYDAVLAPCGLRSTQRSILMHIARAGTPTMGDLAAALVLDRSALAHNLKPLERDGFVTVVVDPADKRSRLVTLTAVGTAKLDESQRLWRQAQHRFEATFGPEQATALRQSLAVISSATFAKAFQDADDTVVV
ncbi:MarR family winged helix-turn-helix transcriptional regulator [Acidisphaera sp. S103]|uniref:MarR family winged helix-turn-helix transcriptional regulator n=1 Tax=Acidisphaera sp. S103 TaxID=1747223 RepID=UPI00131CA70F|nr:MarR family winged helix-turn-helix transcriptional regulator [Acidisphaera sp. S103]